MTRPIDEKIVAMKMDNSDFKRKAIETTGLFGKLQQSLNRIPGVNLGKTSRELGNIASQSRRVDMDPLARSLQTISDRFSTLGVIGTTALVNITNRAVNAGLALQRSLTTDQIRDGFREYEMKMGSIGTMLANTKWAGTGLEEVKDTLNELNEYADQTIYSFAQMTQNIGRFTAAGVTLGDSTVAIKGLGNLAAISGSTSDQLNTAMYQMSQALSAGRLTLMDWNSMTNAGMGGKITQDALIETARAMGIAVDMSDGFRNSIQDGWLTSEVLLETLKKFGADQSMTEAATKVRTFTQMMATLKEGIGSGWAETWELVFGDFEEATLFWTTISETLKKPFDAMAESRNNLLRSIIAGDGLTNMFIGIRNAVRPLGQLFKVIKLSFQTIFPVSSASVINGIAQAFRNLTDGFSLSLGTSGDLYTIFKGIFAIFSSVWEITKALAQAVFGLLPSFKQVGSGALSLLASIAKIPIYFNESIKSGSLLSSVMDVLGVVLGVIGLGLSAVGVGLEWVAEKFRPLGALIGVSFGGGHISQANDELTTMKDILTPIANFFSGIFDAVVNGFNWVKDKLVGFGQMVKEAFPSGNTLFAGGFIAALIAITANAIIMGWKLFEVFTGWGSIGEGISETLESISGAINAFSVGIYAAALLKVAIALAILAGSLYMIQDLDAQQIANGLYAMIGALSGLIGGLAIISKYNLVAQMASVSVIIALSIAMLLMAGAFKKLENVDFDKMVKGIYGIVGMMTALAGALTLMSKFGGGAIGASSLQILAIAGAVHILVSAIRKMSEIDSEALKDGLKTLAIVLAQIAIFMNVMRGAKFGLGATLGMLAIGQAINNIVKAVVKISTIDPQVMKEGLKTIGIILAAIAGFTIATSFGNLFVAGAGMLVIAVALQALMKPIQSLGAMQWDTMVQGLFGMSVALIAIAAASTLMTGTIAGAIGIGLLAGALVLLLGPIMAFSLMSWESIIKGIVGMAGAFLLIGGVAALLGLAAKFMLLFGVSLGVIGVAMLAAGAGMSLLGTGLLALSTLSVGAVTTIIATIGTLLAGLISLAPMAANFIGEITYKVVEAISRHTPMILDKIATFLIGILQTIANRMPEFIDAGTDLITNFIEGVGRAHSAIVLSAVDTVVTYIEGMANAIDTEGPRMTDAMMKLWGAVLLVVVDAGVSMINALFGWIPGVKDATANIGATAEQYIRENFMAGDAGSDKGKEFAGGLSETEKLANESGLTLAEAAQSGVETVKMETSGENFGLGFAGGMSSTLDMVKRAALGIAKTAAGAIADFLIIRSPSRLADSYGTHTGEGFSNGLSSTEKNVEDTANSFAGKIMNALGIKSPVVKSSSEGGTATADAFAKGIESGKPAVTKSAKSVARSATDIFREEMSKAQKQFEMGNLNVDQYIKQIEKIKASYSKYPELVWEANQKIKKIEEDAARESFNNSKEWIDDRKYYNELSLKEELIAWQRIMDKYEEGTEQRKQAEREVYRLKQELEREGFNNSKSWIDERKYYNELSLMEELDAWQRVMNRYEKGTEERKEAEREVYRLKNEINRKLIDLNEEYTSKVAEANRKLVEDEKRLNDEYITKIEDANNRLIESERRLNDEYDKAVSDRTNTLVGFAGLFDKITKSNEVSGTDLIDNLKSQVDTFAEWSGNIQTLTSRGIDQGLVDELRKMGPKASGEVKALTTLTDEQLVEYSALWKEKNQLARNEALKELEGLKSDTRNKISELRSQTAIELDAYKSEWATKVDELRSQTAIQLEAYKNEWVNKIREIKVGATDEFVGLNDSMLDIGTSAMQNLIDGLSDMEGPLMELAGKIASNVSSTISSALNVKTPSITPSSKSTNGFIDGFKGKPISPTKRAIAGKPGALMTNAMVSAIDAVRRQNNNNNTTSNDSKGRVESKSTVINQNLTFNSPQLSPSETARKNIQASRQIATQWGG